MYKAILFDLDGTLTESGEGITKCVQYALEKLGKPEEDLKKLEVFIGKPAGTEIRIFRTWGFGKRSSTGSLRFDAPVRKWEYREQIGRAHV